MNTFNKIYTKRKLGIHASADLVRVRVADLMFRDGFGPGDARKLVAVYCRQIFVGGATPAAATKVATAIDTIEADLLKKGQPPP